MNKSSGNSKIFLVYARALFDSAKEGSKIDKISSDVKKITVILEQDDDAAYKMLSSPIVELEEKRKIASKIFSGGTDELLLNFLDLLIIKNRFGCVGNIFSAYSEMVDREHGIVRGEIKVSKVPEQDNKKRIIDSIQGLINKKVEADFVEDKDLVAGFSASVGSYRLEYSFDSHLKQIEKKLIRG